jgi:hypothetical protein
MSDSVISRPRLQPCETATNSSSEQTLSGVRNLRAATLWNPERFAREQIRGLVRQVFLSTATPPVRQIVFSAADSETDVLGICLRVGEELASETAGTVAVAGDSERIVIEVASTAVEIRDVTDPDSMRLRHMARRMTRNLWLVPKETDFATTESLHSHLGALRDEFDYSIVEAPVPGASNETSAMAQIADGVVLVLSANRTRRATARHIKERLDSVSARILGIVLSDRTFPVPERIYSFL